MSLRANDAAVRVKPPNPGRHTTAAASGNFADMASKGGLLLFLLLLLRRRRRRRLAGYSQLAVAGQWGGEEPAELTDITHTLQFVSLPPPPRTASPCYCSLVLRCCCFLYIYIYFYIFFARVPTVTAHRMRTPIIRRKHTRVWTQARRPGSLVCQAGGRLSYGAFQAAHNPCFHNLLPMKVPWNDSQTRNSVLPRTRTKSMYSHSPARNLRTKKCLSNAAFNVSPRIHAGALSVAAMHTNLGPCSGSNAFLPGLKHTQRMERGHHALT